MFLIEHQKSQIKQLLFSPQWNTIQLIAEEMIKEIQGQSSIRDSEYETLRETFLKEGKERGIRDFLQKLLDLTK